MSGKISDMPAATPILGTELIEVVQGGQNKKSTVGTAAARMADNLPALRSSVADTGSVTTGHLRAVIASSNSTASGIASANVASLSSTASGIASANVSSSSSTASGDKSANVASTRVINSLANSLALGYAAAGDALTANRKIHLFAETGNISIAGALSSGVIFSDFAEMFANREGIEIPAGTILTHDGDGVKIAQDGDEIAGVVSYTPAVLAGDTPFCWQGRYLHDEFGRRVYEDILDPDYEGEGTAPVISVQKENPDWDPTKEQVTRSERPQEWTPVGLLGQVYVRVGKDVLPGDKLKAVNGIGVKASTKKGLRCMVITQEFAEEKGYAVARCMINVSV